MARGFHTWEWAAITVMTGEHLTSPHVCVDTSPVHVRGAWPAGLDQPQEHSQVPAPPQRVYLVDADLGFHILQPLLQDGDEGGGWH